MGLTAKIALAISATLAGAPDVGSASYSISEKFETLLRDGTGANQAKNVFADDFAVVGAGTQTYDVAGGVVNGLGATVTFTAIKAIIIKNTGAAAITFGGGSNPLGAFFANAADQNVIPAGGLVALVDPTAAGQPVTAGTGDIITLAGTDFSGTIIVIGETA